MPDPEDTVTAYVVEGNDDDSVYTDENDSVMYIGSAVDSDRGYLYRLHRALNLEYARLYNAATGMLYALLPDNEFFTLDDARAWYRRWGMYDSGSVSLTDMMAAIRQRASWPVTPLNKQNYLFIQEQLRAAGFDVYVYPNRFPDGMGGYVAKTPAEVLGTPIGRAVLGNFDLGQLNLAASYAEAGITTIINYLEEDKEVGYVIHNESSFFIAGATITTLANVPAPRKIEFRQLILRLKAQEMAAFLFVNFV